MYAIRSYYDTGLNLEALKEMIADVLYQLKKNQGEEQSELIGE